MTKSIKKALEHLSNQTEWCIEPERLSGVTVDRVRQREIIDHTLKEIEAIIRTEKLKLLAEVRERVVGEDELYAEVRDGIRIVGQSEKPRNELRTEQRAALNKLEAEL